MDSDGFYWNSVSDPGSDRGDGSDLPLKTLGSGGEAPPRRPKSEDLPLKALGSGASGRRAGSAPVACPETKK